MCGLWKLVSIGRLWRWQRRRVFCVEFSAQILAAQPLVELPEELQDALFASAVPGRWVLHSERVDATVVAADLQPPVRDPNRPHQVDVGQDGRRSLRAPAFFISQSDKGYRGQFFTPGSEAERRISFFAQSLTTAVPEPLPVDAMPTFTVLTPHYSEKVCLY